MTGAAWVPLILAVVAAIAGGGLVGAILAHKRGTRSDFVTALSRRLTEVETELKEQREWRRAQEARYSTLWAYCRQLIDYAYRHRRDGSPALPDMPDDLT